VNVALGFWQIEAERDRAVHLQRGAGLDRESVFMQVEQFAQVNHHAGFWTVETGVDGSMELLADAATSIGVANPGKPLRYSWNTPIHNCHHINSALEGKGGKIGDRASGRRVHGLGSFRLLCPADPEWPAEHRVWHFQACRDGENWHQSRAL
jgi:hypothetical protein